MVDATTTAAASAKTITPVSPRGRRTREALLAAARRVFDREGFLNARITDITEEASVSNGSFYTYFSSKEEIFKEIALRLQDEMLTGHADDPRTPHDDDPVVAIERGHRRYLLAYRENAALMGTIDQVATFNPDLLSIRQARADAFIARTAQLIEELQARGLARSEVNPRYMAIALTAMVSRYAYMWFVEGIISHELDFEESVRSLTLLWADALHLDTNEWHASGGARTEAEGTPTEPHDQEAQER